MIVCMQQTLSKSRWLNLISPPCLVCMRGHRSKGASAACGVHAQKHAALVRIPHCFICTQIFSPHIHNSPTSCAHLPHTLLPSTRTWSCTPL